MNRIPEGQSKPQHPKNMNKSSVQLIMAYDLCGWKQKDIADALGLSQSRVSIIATSPLYVQTKTLRMVEMQKQVTEKKSDTVVSGDPIQQKIKELALDAIGVKATLLTNAKNEYVRNSVASDLLDRAGYKPETKKTITSVEVTEKMADRFSRVMSMDEETGKQKITIRTEVSE